MIVILYFKSARLNRESEHGSYERQSIANDVITIESLHMSVCVYICVRPDIRFRDMLEIRQQCGCLERRLSEQSSIITHHLRLASPRSRYRGKLAE